MVRKSPTRYLIASLVLYCALWVLVPRARFIPAALSDLDSAIKHAHQPWATVLTIFGIILLSSATAVFVAAQMWIIYSFSGLRLGFKQSLLWLVGCLAASAGTVSLMLWQIDIVGKLHRLPTAAEVIFIMGMLRGTPLSMVVFLLIMLAAASVGYAVSLRIKDKNLLLPVVMFAAAIDFWTVTIGPVSHILAKHPEVVQAVSMPIPRAGTGAFIPATMMGPGDALFMALVFAAVMRSGLNGRRNFWFVFTFVTLAMLAVQMGILSQFPGLVALAAAVVLANWGQFRLTRQEKISTAIVGLVLIASLPLVWHFLRPCEPPEKPHAPVRAPRSRP